MCPHARRRSAPRSGCTKPAIAISNVVKHYGLIVAAGLVLFLSPFASKSPDGLDRVAETHGFATAARSFWATHTPFSQYVMPGIHSAPVATALAGLFGTVIVFFLARWTSRLLIPGEPRIFEHVE